MVGCIVVLYAFQMRPSPVPRPYDFFQKHVFCSVPLRNEFHPGVGVAM